MIVVTTTSSSRTAEGTETVTDAARALTSHVRRIAELELQLALAEARMSLRRLVVAAVAGVTAVMLVTFGSAFLLAAIAAALALAIPTWAALLVVSLALLATAALLVLVAIASARRASPIPQAAIDEARNVVDVVRNGNDRR